MLAVAQAAKVSIFTVSAVLNGTSVVSDERRERVEQAIRATGYKRNSVARSLKTGRTQTVGVIIGDITNPFYTDVVAAIQQVLYRGGYGVMLCCNERNVTLQEDHIAVLRDRMLEIVNADYIKTAFAKGLRPHQVVLRHQVRNALFPVLTILGPAVASVLTGSFVVETVFAIPGLGRYFVTAMQNLDYTLVMGLTIFFGAFLIGMNFLVDVAYGLIDPRVRIS